MSAACILWSQILVVFAIVLATTWGATQWTAWRLAFAALRPARAALNRISLGPAPSLHRLRRRLRGFVRRLPRHYGRVRLPWAVHHRITGASFPMRADTGRTIPFGHPMDIPVPVQIASTRAGGLGPCRALAALAMTRRLVLPSAFLYGVGALDRKHFAAQCSARVFPCQRFTPILADDDA